MSLMDDAARLATHCAFCPSETTLDIEQLRALPLITSEVIGRKLRLTAYLEEERHEVMLEPGMISENRLFLRQAILAGLGIGIVPDYLIRDDLQRGDVVTMLNEWCLSIFGTRMYLLYMPNLHHTHATSTLIEFILERARTEALAGSHKTAAVPSARAPIEARQPD